MLSWPLDFKLYIALLLLPVLSVGFLASDALALGETYTMQNGAIVISGGNARSVSGSSISLPPTNDPGVFGWTQQGGSTVAVSEGYCLDATARLTVYVNPQSNTVLSVDFSCAGPERAGDRFDTLTAWSTNVSYSTTPGSPPPGDSGGGIDISGLTVHTFSNPTGSAIRACDGIYNQFSGNGCIDYTAVANEDGRITYRATVNSILASCGSGNARQSIFKLQLVEPRTPTNDRLAADFTVEQRSTCPGMNYNGWDSDQARRINIVGANQLTDMLGNEVESESEEPEATSTCVIKHGLGWILCPVMNTLAAINDGAWWALERFLISPTMTREDGGAYAVWQMMRNVANVLFVLFFLVIVYSQITSVGITNYGIKKLLPKLIVGAILVNASWLIVAGAVDLSNVLGKSLYSINGALVDVSNEPMEGSGDGGTPNWQYAVGGLLMGTIGTVALVMAGLTVALPLLLGAIFFVGGLVIVLTFRNALVLILAVLAPIAFVAYLLPGTNGFFRTWYTLFKAVLLIYPAAALAMGMSNVAAAVTWKSAQDNNDWIMMFVAAAMPAMGIILALLVAKTMGSVMSRFGVTNPFGGVINSAKDRAGKFGERRDKGLSARASRGGRFRRNAFGNIGGHKGKMMRDMKNETSNAKFEAAMLGTSAGQSNYRSRGAAQQMLSGAKSKAEIDELEFNKELHINAAVDNLRLDAAKSGFQAEIDEQAATSGTAANTAAMSKARSGILSAAATAAVKSDIDREVAEGGNAISDATRDKYLFELSSASSGRITAENNAKALESSAYLQQIASGADTVYGPDRARSIARETQSKLANERIDTEAKSMSNMTGTDAWSELSTSTSLSEERQAALARHIVNNGTEVDIKNLIDTNSTLSSTARQEIGANIGSRGLGSIGQGAIAELKAGKVIADFDSLAASRVDGGSLSGGKVAKLSEDELKIIHNSILSKAAAPGSKAAAYRAELKSSIDEYITNASTTGVSIDGKVLTQMRNIHGSL